MKRHRQARGRDCQRGNVSGKPENVPSVPRFYGLDALRKGFTLPSARMKRLPVAGGFGGVTSCGAVSPGTVSEAAGSVTVPGSSTGSDVCSDGSGASERCTAAGGWDGGIAAG